MSFHFVCIVNRTYLYGCFYSNNKVNKFIVFYHPFFSHEINGFYCIFLETLRFRRWMNIQSTHILVVYMYYRLIPINVLIYNKVWLCFYDQLSFFLFLFNVVFFINFQQHVIIYVWLIRNNLFHFFISLLFLKKKLK